MMFEDRSDAGRQLAERLAPLKPEFPVVLALPRGGVPVAFEVARALKAPLDLVLVRKIGAPHQPELAIGAVVDGATPELVTNDPLIAELGVPAEYLESAKAKALAEIERRRKLYLGGHEPVALRGRTAIVIDDGIATGATVSAALRATRRRGPAGLVLAVPVAPPESIEALRGDADRIECLAMPGFFMAVGQFYRRFPQTDDAEVTALMAAARQWSGPGSAADTAPGGGDGR